LTLTSDLSGQLQFANNGVNLPMGGVAPAFSAYGNALSFPNSTWTKIPFQTEEFDTNNNFDSTTNYRFTPTVAGYYQVNCAIYFGFTTGSATLSIYKNGSEFKRGSANAGVSGGVMPISSCLVYLNGSTDYVEMYLFQNTGTAQSSNGGSNLQWFNGSLVRGA
jgi:hypothetical protein